MNKPLKCNWCGDAAHIPGSDAEADCSIWAGNLVSVDIARDAIIRELRHHSRTDTLLMHALREEQGVDNGTPGDLACVAAQALHSLLCDGCIEADFDFIPSARLKWRRRTHVAVPAFLPWRKS